jgi:hypothetical protein
MTTVVTIRITVWADTCTGSIVQEICSMLRSAFLHKTLRI